MPKNGGDMIEREVLIIGAGPVGLFTVFEAGMLGMKSVVVDSLEEIGGQCTALYPEKPIYDIPAFKEVTGKDLIENLSKQNEVFNPEYILNQFLTNISKEEDYFISTTSKGQVIKSKIIVIAAGAGSFVPNRPPLDNIESYEGKSIFYMVKHRGDFKGKKIAIAGGGDSAVDWAISLAELADKIYLIHRRNKFRAHDASMDKVSQLVEEGKVEMVTTYQLKALKGPNGCLEEVVVADLDGNEKHLEADILLPFFGLATDLGPVKSWGLDFENFHLKVDQSNSQTNIDGIYAVGDVASYPGKVKLILIGFSEAAIALHHAYPRVFDGKALHFEYSTTKGTKN